MTGQFNPVNPFAMPVPAKPQVPEDQKTVVTYHDLDRTGQPVTFAGVPFMDGDTVDLAKFMDEGRAKELAFKLSGNRYFTLDGEADPEKVQADHDKAVARREEEVRKAQERQQARLNPKTDDADKPGQEPPASVATPEVATLEANPAQTRQGNRTPPRRNS